MDFEGKVAEIRKNIDKASLVRSVADLSVGTVISFLISRRFLVFPVMILRTQIFDIRILVASI